MIFWGEAGVKRDASVLAVIDCLNMTEPIPLSAALFP